jgi:putative DNA primase/helicase
VESDDEALGQTPRAPDEAIPAGENTNPLAAEPARPDPIFGAEFSDSFRGDVSATDLTEAEEERRRELHAEAVRSWERGYRIIPVHHMVGGACSCGDTECSSPGKHPVGTAWQKPEMDPDADASWWRRLAADERNPINWRPASNLGILTGEHSGFFVLDVDITVVDGFATLGQLEAEHPEEPIPATLTVATGSGGRHYYFRWPGGSYSNSKPFGKGSGIDIKANGGFVVAPPSISGRGSYTFHQDITDISQIARAPGWIIRAMKEHQDRQLGKIVGNPPAVPDKQLRRYMEAVLEGVISMLRHAPEGERNNTLNQAAFRLGQFGSYGLVHESEARQLLTDAGLAIGMTRREVANTITSGWRSGLTDPADLSKIGQLTDHEWHLYPWTPFGLADRLVAYFGEHLRYIEEKSSWLTYMNGTWQYRTEAEPQRIAQDLIRLLPEVEAPSYGEEIIGDQEESPRDLFLQWVARCSNRASVANTALLARDRPAIRAAAASFDENDLMINVRNGIWDAEHGELIPHAPERLLTMQANVIYDANARCPLWDEFLKQMQPEPEWRAYLYRLWGHSLTADLSEREFVLHHGPTATGKSVMNNVISSVAGSYSQTVPVETLLLTPNASGIPADIARMEGKRYLSASETRAGKQLNEALVKQLTGGDTMAARFLHQNFFEFKPTGKIHLISNHRVHLSTDGATQDRLHMVEWNQSIPRPRRDKSFARRIIHNEASGVFNRLLEGLADWMNRGDLAPPDEAERVKSEFLASEDWRVQFVDACCIEVPPEKGMAGRSTKELYAAYKYWLHDVAPGSKPMAQSTFVVQLSEKYEHCDTKTKDRKHWRGFPGLEVLPFFGQVL